MEALADFLESDKDEIVLKNIRSLEIIQDTTLQKK